MVDETELLDMADEDLFDILRTHSPTNERWEGARAALEIRNAKRMVCSAKRMEWATYVILTVTLVQLALSIVPCFRR